MISRRGLFRLLGGLAASPVLKPLAGLIPVSGIPWWGRGLWKRRRTTLEVYYEPALMAALKKQTDLTERTANHEKYRRLPERTGRTIQFFTYKLPERAA